MLNFKNLKSKKSNLTQAQKSSNCKGRSRRFKVQGRNTVRDKVKLRMKYNVLAVSVWTETGYIESDDCGVVAGVERVGHGWADEGVETGENTQRNGRYVHAPTEPQAASEFTPYSPYSALHWGSVILK